MESAASTQDIPLSAVSTTIDEQSLVAAAKSGDSHAFAELYRPHFNKTLQRLYRITRNWEDAEDALQDSLVRAFVHIVSFDERSCFATWHTRIAINSALMILRKKRSHPEVSVDSSSDDDGETWLRWEIPAPGFDPEGHYAHRERNELLNGAIRRLKPQFRKVVELQMQRQYSTQQIAQTLGISLAATKSRLSRAKSRLRRSLEHSGTVKIARLA